MYAEGRDHSYRDPCLHVLRLLREGRLRAAASVALVQEYAHVMLRRQEERPATMARIAAVAGTCELLDFPVRAVPRMLALLEDHPRLDAQDAVHAATAITYHVRTIIATDRAFDDVSGLERIDPRDRPRIDALTG